MKDIINYNNKGEYHDYQEWYNLGELELRGNYKHHKEIGYEEWHAVKETTYYIR